MLEVSLARKEPKLISTCQFKNYHKDAFCFDLQNVFQMQSIQPPDQNLLWHEWKTKFLLISHMHAATTCKVRCMGP